MNKSNQLISTIILAAVLFVSGCTGAKNILQAKYIEGEIVVVGNEPFTSLAIRTTPLNTFILDCNKEARDFLLNNQGKTAKIYYEKIDDTKVPNVIFVEKYELIIKEIQ